MKYKIIGDSCLDLTKEMRKDPVYTLIPFTLMVGDRQFVDDESFDQKEFLKIVRESPECAKSACPSPEMFKEAYCCEEPNVFVITISGPLSGSYNSAVLAKKLYEEAENYSELTGVLDMDSSELEVEVYKPLADVDNRIAEYYDDKKAEVIIFKTANGIVNGFINIKEELDENNADEDEDDLSDVILIHLTYDQVQDIMDDIDNWSCIGNPYY